MYVCRHLGLATSFKGDIYLSIYQLVIHLNDDVSWVYRLMKSKGLSTDLWCTPTFTTNSSLCKPFTITLVLEECTSSLSSIFATLVDQITSLCTLSNLFLMNQHKTYSFWSPEISFGGVKLKMFYPCLKQN